MCEALRREGMESFVFSLSDCLHDLSRRQVTIGGVDLSSVDGIVVKKLGDHPSPVSRLRLHMLRQLESMGVRIYSRPSVIDVAMDRYRMSMNLIEAGFAVPRTFSVENEATASQALQGLGQAVAKPIYTSKARGMVRLNGHATDLIESAALAEGPLLLQEYVDSRGRDVGVCVLGGRFVGAFARVAADGEWITSSSAGGRYEPFALPEKAIDLAEGAAETFGLDYTVVDLVETADGYLVYEVSAFGGFRGLWEAARYNVAADYARYVKWDLLS